MLFYVRRHTGADGSFEWYVLNGHTRRRASKAFPTRAGATAERERLQARLDLAKAKVLRRAPRGQGRHQTEAARRYFRLGQRAVAANNKRSDEQASARRTASPVVRMHARRDPTFRQMCASQRREELPPHALAASLHSPQKKPRGHVRQRPEFY